MKQARLREMVNGWFIGNFEPSIARSTACEVAVKHHAVGDHEEVHHHRVATEVIVVVSRPGESNGKDPGSWRYYAFGTRRGH